MNMFDTITNEDLINGTEDFALVHINSKIIDDDSKYYYITPILEKYEDGTFCIAKESCYSNREYLSFVPNMSKEEMMMKFEILYGKTVEYEVEYEMNTAYSGMKLAYQGKLRK